MNMLRKFFSKGLGKVDKKAKNSPPKKWAPGSGTIFIIAAIFILLTIQSFFGEQESGVSFSYQVEPLVNLDLLQENESRKIAQNDNLVTFTGKFKDHISEEGKSRFRYLELLNQNHKLEEQRDGLNGELISLKKDVQSSSELLATLSGIKIPSGGLEIISPIYNSNWSDANVTVYSPLDAKSVNLKELRLLLDNPSDIDNVQQFGKNIAKTLIYYQSPELGIGNESLKTKLRTATSLVEETLPNSHENLAAVMSKYGIAIATLEEVTQELLTERDHAKLRGLRSVRNYLSALSDYSALPEQIQTNGAQLRKARQKVTSAIWFFNDSQISTRSLEAKSYEQFNIWFNQAKQEWDKFQENKGATFKAPDQPRNAVLEKTFKSQEPSNNYFSYLILSVLPVVILILLLYFIFAKQMKGMGSGAMKFGKSPARMLNKEENNTTFDDVAGIVEAKDELQEVVEFLKHPLKFTALGAKLPKGVLLVGPPGTGKTLIAKAVAGEANCPFFPISGSDFVEMFVGVGASRIRDLFDQAKKNAPCIIFIDEIDAVGRHRGAGIGGGHDEREQTLNQLLVEMDGFKTEAGVILIAATNRPDVLDTALLRPGRFDRTVILDLPDINGRVAILQVHARGVKLDDSVNLRDIARASTGASGADLMNILNEAALIAAKKGQKAVSQLDAMEACEKVRYGKERKSLEVGEEEKRQTAFHEAGHAIVGIKIEYVDPIEQVTIVPRKFSLGSTHFIPEKNKMTQWKKDLKKLLIVLMAGRVAEETFLGDLSSGAQEDISQATDIARKMVSNWGMVAEAGPVSYNDMMSDDKYIYPGKGGRRLSETAVSMIDQAVKNLLNEATAKATKIIDENRDVICKMVDALMKFETIRRADILSIIDGTWDPNGKSKVGPVVSSVDGGGAPSPSAAITP